VRKSGWIVAGVFVLLVAAVIGLQLARERLTPLALPEGASTLIHVRSPQTIRRIALTFDSIAADVYWIRAIQYYGATKLSTDPRKTFANLYPLLDLTTSLDPHFSAAYRFGAIFLSEPFPDGAGRTDLAVALLEKGLQFDPKRWEYAQDIGFVHYWWRKDYSAAADWFLRAAEIPGAPDWLRPVAAVTLAEGGSTTSSRRLWQEVLANAEVNWLRASARRRLLQLDAVDQIQELLRRVAAYAARFGMLPRSWSDMIRAGYLKGIPVDPEGYEYFLDTVGGGIGLHPKSPLNPLPVVQQAPPDAPGRP
jgi:hypothetical protein